MILSNETLRDSYLDPSKSTYNNTISTIVKVPIII
jgi:hypothetical protein